MDLKGSDLAFLRSSQKAHPLLTGGDQESGMRAGTENLPGIIGMAKAIELLNIELPAATYRMALLRDRLEMAFWFVPTPLSSMEWDLALPIPAISLFLTCMERIC